MLQLLQRSQDVMEKRKKLYERVFGFGVIGDCSQKDNWSAFRNEQFNGLDFAITPTVFTPFPTQGKLNFDFCASDNPSASVTALSDKRCINCLVALGLMDDSERSRAQDALNTWREYGIETAGGTGRELPIADYPRALSIQQYSNRFCTTLKERPEQLVKASKREDIQIHKQKLAAKINRAKKLAVATPVNLPLTLAARGSVRDLRSPNLVAASQRPSRVVRNSGVAQLPSLRTSIREFQQLQVN